MAVENHGPMGLDRKGIDNKILDELHDGRNVPSNLAEELDVSRQYISQRLKLLEAADHVENVGRGVYQLVDDPRENADPAPDVDELQERIDTLESDLTEARADVERYKDELEDCRQRLADAPDPAELERTISELEKACERGDGNAVEAALGRLREAAGVTDA